MTSFSRDFHNFLTSKNVVLNKKTFKRILTLIRKEQEKELRKSLKQDFIEAINNTGYKLSKNEAIIISLAGENLSIEFDYDFFEPEPNKEKNTETSEETENDTDAENDTDPLFSSQEIFILDWSKRTIDQWITSAHPHCVNAIRILANAEEGVSYTTAELNVLVNANSRGPLVGGLQAWASRMGLEKPLVQDPETKRYSFVSVELKLLFRECLKVAPTATKAAY